MWLILLVNCLNILVYSGYSMFSNVSHFSITFVVVMNSHSVPCHRWVLQAPAETAFHFQSSWSQGPLLFSSAASLLPLDFCDFAENWQCAGPCSHWMSATYSYTLCYTAVCVLHSFHFDSVTTKQLTLTFTTDSEDGRSRKMLSSSTFASSEAMWRHVRPLFRSCRNDM